MQQQVDINDCGLFATACAFELYKNKNPAKIYFKQSHEKVPIEIKSEADYQPGTKKAKLKTVKIWLITMVIPRRFVANLTKEVMDMYDDDVDTEMVDDATAQGITTDSAVNQQPEEGGFQ